MNLEGLKSQLAKIPVGMLLVGYLLYIGSDYYSFMTDLSSPLLLKKQQIQAQKDVKLKLEKRIFEGNLFLKTLEAKKAEIRRLAQELQGMKETLSERSDVPGFMKMIITEAKKIGVVVQSLKPLGSKDKEYYTETIYSIQVNGVFSQVIGLMDRLSNVAEIVKVDNVVLKPVGSSSDKFVKLVVLADIKTYKYRGSSADNLGKSDKSNSDDQKQKANVKSADSIKAPGSSS